MPASDVVLIPGCSPGIGRETATLLVGEGDTVHAAARKMLPDVAFDAFVRTQCPSPTTARD